MPVGLSEQEAATALDLLVRPLCVKRGGNKSDQNSRTAHLSTFLRSSGVDQVEIASVMREKLFYLAPTTQREA